MRSLYKFLLVSCCLFSEPAFATPIDVSFPTPQGITITGKLYTPASPAALAPAVVMMHGCSGIYSFSDPAKGLALLYNEWGERLAKAGYVALLVDSFTGRNTAQNQCDNGSSGVSEVTDRPYDAYGAWQFLKTSYSGWVDPAKIALLGWSHGASSTMSTLSNTGVSQWGKPFKAGFAFYPGCGLYGAFGGISTSTYAPYAPLYILHGSVDPFYTIGYCDKRINNAIKLGSTNMSMSVYLGGQHSLDNARAVDSTWTQADVDAKASADAFVMLHLKNLFK